MSLVSIRTTHAGLTVLELLQILFQIINQHDAIMNNLLGQEPNAQLIMECIEQETQPQPGMPLARQCLTRHGTIHWLRHTWHHSSIIPLFSRNNVHLCAAYCEIVVWVWERWGDCEGIMRMSYEGVCVAATAPNNKCIETALVQAIMCRHGLHYKCTTACKCACLLVLTRKSNMSVLVMAAAMSFLCSVRLLFSSEWFQDLSVSSKMNISHACTENRSSG